MSSAHIRSTALRGVLMTLAVLALVMRIAAPQGYMVQGSSVGGVQLVICTGAGPLKSGPADPVDKSKTGGACAFAGQGSGAAPEPAPTVEPAAIAYTAMAEPVVPADLAPGRGLAAPPPPSLGPPLEA